ncbi:hypothetical protein B0T14DRAFT_569614 [Immersiella caudata]|uniref:Amidase domain-containing protein n=1 Tax=Immersiella caudata TaxID=314043 RepID=A0AA39WDV3_9PEZI|nr:hypothetical protein B0T14DRAFT_569614 [Immersiella caudata]
MAYLKLCETLKAETLGELIQFNKDRTDKELPAGTSNQDMLKTCHNTNVSQEEYERYIAHAEKYGRDLGVNKIMDDYNLNIILGPIECHMVCFAATAGELLVGAPLAAMPLGDLNFNGRPHGLCAMADRTTMPSYSVPERI